jgi:hypothetical protein
MMAGMEITELQPVEEKPQLPPLSQEERNDMRKKVLAGYQLSVEEARRVYETLRQGQGAVLLTKEKRSRKKKEALSDEALNASLDAKLGL